MTWRTEAYLALLKDYYDCVAQPVLDEGGEILDYIGDAVLAIFPCGATLACRKPPALRPVQWKRR